MLSSLQGLIISTTMAQLLKLLTLPCTYQRYKTNRLYVIIQALKFNNYEK